MAKLIHNVNQSGEIIIYTTITVVYIIISPDWFTLSRISFAWSVRAWDRHHFALRPQKRGGLLGTGGEGDERVKARPRPISPEKDRRDRGPPPEQWKCQVKAVSPRHCGAATSALRSCCFNCRAGQSHKDDVRCTAVEEQPEAKEVQLSQPSSTDLLAHDLFWANLRVQLHLPPLDLAWNPVVMTHTPDGCCAPVGR